MAFNPQDNSFEVALATKMQLYLDQPMSDISTGLTNRDYEGDFFKIGDTVSVVKPDIDSVVIEVGTPITPAGERQTFTFIAGTNLSNNTVDDPANYASGVNDAKLKVRDLTFSKSTLKIDKTAKYAFAVSDITKAEGKWDYASGGLDLAQQRLRKAHNIGTMNLALSNPVGSDKTNNIRALQTADGVDKVFGTAANPIKLSNADELYENIILEMYARLYDKGAITADGQYTFGSNPTEKKQTYGRIYMPTKLYTMLLKSKYFTDRSTVAADEKVKTGSIKTITNLDVNIEPALVNSTVASVKNVTVAGAANGVMCIIAGTSNCITRAGKVLPPERQRSITRFAEEFHGMEIYGEKIFNPECAVVAFVKMAEPEQPAQPVA